MRFDTVYPGQACWSHAPAALSVGKQARDRSETRATALDSEANGYKHSKLDTAPERSRCDADRYGVVGRKHPLSLTRSSTVLTG